MEIVMNFKEYRLLVEAEDDLDVLPSMKGIGNRSDKAKSDDEVDNTKHPLALKLMSKIKPKIEKYFSDMYNKSSENGKKYIDY
jgi:hypothetical protein